MGISIFVGTSGSHQDIKPCPHTYTRLTDSSSYLLGKLVLPLFKLSSHRHHAPLEAQVTVVGLEFLIAEPSVTHDWRCWLGQGHSHSFFNLLLYYFMIQASQREAHALFPYTMLGSGCAFGNSMHTQILFIYFYCMQMSKQIARCTAIDLKTRI